MIFIWRGRGPLGLFVLIIPFASCGVLISWNENAAITLSGLTLFVGGLICRHFGVKWNQGSGYHMMYWVPLEYWGWLYIVTGGLFGSLGIAAVIKKAILR